MKISIITLQNVANYGSVLQTYATQLLFQGMGYDVEFIDYIRKNQTRKYIQKSQIDRSSIQGFIKSMYRIYIGGAMIHARMHRVFEKFVQKRIHISSRKYYSVEELQEYPPLADIYCTGSDQMWNSGWNGGIERSYYLDFVDKKPKFSFSTSIGMDTIPENEIEETLRLLQDYRFITVREKSAADLLNRYGISAKPILDPTLLVDGAFWRNFCQDSRKKLREKQGKYILVYQLNSGHDSVDFIRYVKNLSKQMGLQVKVISYGLKIKRVFGEYVCLPMIEEFVSLFANAEYVVTDSFHGTSFCVNLNKPFTVIYPPKYASRLVNILQLCGLEDRVYTGVEKDLHLNQINFDRVNSIMQKARTESLDKIEKGLAGIRESII